MVCMNKREQLTNCERERERYEGGSYLKYRMRDLELGSQKKRIKKDIQHKKPSAVIFFLCVAWGIELGILKWSEDLRMA